LHAVVCFLTRQGSDRTNRGVEHNMVNCDVAIYALDKI